MSQPGLCLQVPTGYGHLEGGLQFSSIPFQSIQFSSVRFNSVQFNSIKSAVVPTGALLAGPNRPWTPRWRPTVQFSAIQFKSFPFQFNKPHYCPSPGSACRSQQAKSAQKYSLNSITLIQINSIQFAKPACCGSQQAKSAQKEAHNSQLN